MLLILAILAPAPGGCDAPPETVVGSDVPQIVGLESRHSSEIERDGETLVGGRFLYRGAMRTPVEVADDTMARFKRFGWTLETRRVMPTSAHLTFVKDDREAEVILQVNTLNPAMGAGTLDVRRRGASADRAPAPSGAPSPAPPSAPARSPAAAPPAEAQTGPGSAGSMPAQAPAGGSS